MTTVYIIKDDEKKIVEIHKTEADAQATLTRLNECHYYEEWFDANISTNEELKAFICKDPMMRMMITMKFKDQITPCHCGYTVETATL